MSEFFKGWRRQVGVVTLVMACVFAMGWVRSNAIEDQIVRKSAALTQIEFFSSHGYLVWLSSSKPYVPAKSRLSWSAIPAHLNGFKFNSYCKNTSWALRQIGFGIGNVEWSGGFNRIVLAIPYWSIVIPLTLASAFLLLSKPRISTSKTIIEPISAEGK